MPKFIFNKLVRDQVLQRSLDDPKVRVKHYVLEDEAFKKELIAKIHEEAAEVPVQCESDDEVVSELADVQAVIDALQEAYGISDEQLAAFKKKKHDKNGSFEKKAYIEYVDLDDDSEWIEHFRAAPDKYKEVK